MKKDGLEKAIKNIEVLRVVHDSIGGTVKYEMTEDVISLVHGTGCSCKSCSTLITDDVDLHDLVEQHVIELFDKAWDENEHSFVSKLISRYGEVGEYAYDVSNGSGVGVSVDFMHSGVRDDLANDAKLRITSIKGTTKKMLARELSQAYEGAENVGSWMNRIKSVMDIPDWRADMIARTEISHAFNKSNQSAYKEAGVLKVKWLTIVDNRTCPTCRDRNDQTYDVSEVPAVPAHPRCRCTTVAIL